MGHGWQGHEGESGGLGHLGFWGLGADNMSVLPVTIQQAVHWISVKIYIKNPACFSPCLGQQEKPRAWTYCSWRPLQAPYSSCVASGKPLPLSGLSFPLLNEEVVFLFQAVQWGQRF